jgi:hypothetical protein
MKRKASDTQVMLLGKPESLFNHPAACTNCVRGLEGKNGVTSRVRTSIFTGGVWAIQCTEITMSDSCASPQLL